MPYPGRFWRGAGVACAAQGSIFHLVFPFRPQFKGRQSVPAQYLLGKQAPRFRRFCDFFINKLVVKGCRSSVFLAGGVIQGIGPRPINSAEAHRTGFASWKEFNALQAFRMATTSAWAVGSLAAVTELAPRAMMTPSFTTTAPKGPPLPSRTLSMERRMASCMYILD
jgi:hypothetical protein